MVESGKEVHLIELTPRCHQVLAYAVESLPRLGHSHVTGAHLVLGLVALDGGVASRLLKRAGLSIEFVERYLSTLRLSQEATMIRDDIPLVNSGWQAFERAGAEVLTRGFHYLGTEHLLLGLLLVDSGEAAELFEFVDLDRVKMTEAVREAIP